MATGTGHKAAILNEDQLRTAMAEIDKAYESEHISFPEVSSVDVLRHIMTENGLRQSDQLDVVETRSVALEGISGKRPLTMKDVRQLSDRFRVPSEVFLGK